MFIAVLKRLRSFLLVFWLRNYYNFTIFKNVRFYSSVRVYGFGKISIGNNTSFGSKVTFGTVNPSAVINIGSNCYINGTIFCAAKSIIIEDDCILSDCELMDTSSHGIMPDKRKDPNAVKIKEIFVDKNVWIGSRVIVLPGISIGQNSIIGVNSVVSKNINDNVFAAGIPAKEIHSLIKE